MASIKFVLEKILLNQYDFCCLCFNSIGQSDKVYHVHDEIVFNKKNTRNLFEILSCFVGSEVLNNLTSSILVCHLCTETAINCYKFIMDCRRKSLQLWHTIHILFDYFKYSNKEMNMCKSLIISVNARNIKDYYHDSVLDNKSDILNIIQEVSENEFVQDNFELKAYSKDDVHVEHGVDIKSEKHKKSKKRRHQSVKIIDIIFDKNNLSQFKCKMCHNTFSRGPNLKKHYYNVHAPKIFKCSLCPKRFGSAFLLKTHRNHNHCAALCCAECGKVYNSVHALESHEKQHKTRHVCEHCGKIYKTKYAFKKHIDEYHNGVTKNSKPYFICDLCGKRYSQKSAIRLHIKFEHGNGKFYECEWCKKKFSSMSHLREHIITHTQEKSFICEMCGRQFGTKWSLLYHTRTHTGERPYHCQHCDNSFLSASRRMTHIKQHHMPAAQECDVCLKKFKLRSYLLRHRQKHFDRTTKLHNNA